MSNSSGGGGLWPAADFDHWPQTRVVSLVFDGVVALLFILSTFVPCLRRYVCPPCSECAGDESACQRLVLPIFIGLLFGLWLHFIPCIWWTCDWGDHDGAGIRGGIWFITWGIVSTSLCCMRSRPKRGAGELDPARGIVHENMCP